MPPFVDAHVHFWDPERFQYTWLAEVPAIAGRTTPAELLTAADGLDLAAIVFVQADCAPHQGLAEAQWASELAAFSPDGAPEIGAIVAFAPVSHGTAVRGALARLAELPLVRGVRQLIQSEAPGFAARPDFIAGVRQLPDFGFSFDICIYHHQLGDVLKLVEACPDVAFVLDHCGKPDIKNALRQPWSDQIGQLADFPNVACKLSGLVTEADHVHWQPVELQPYIKRVLEVFGPERIMFGGDWPVSALASSYRHWVQTARAAVAHLSPDEQARIFDHNARAFYRLASTADSLAGDL